MNTETKVAEWKTRMVVDGKEAVQELLCRSFDALGHLAAADPHAVAGRVLGKRDVET